MELEGHALRGRREGLMVKGEVLVVGPDRPCDHRTRTRIDLAAESKSAARNVRRFGPAASRAPSLESVDCDGVVASSASIESPRRSDVAIRKAESSASPAAAVEWAESMAIA